MSWSQPIGLPQLKQKFIYVNHMRHQTPRPHCPGGWVESGEKQRIHCTTTILPLPPWPENLVEANKILCNWETPLGAQEGKSAAWSCHGTLIPYSEVAPKWVCTQTFLFIQEKTGPIMSLRKTKCLCSL